MYRLPRNKKGFTLVETVVFIGVFAFVMAALIYSLVYLYRSNRYSIEQAVAVDSARKGAKRAVRDMREATFSDNGSYPIESMNETELVFYSNIDEDVGVERVRFFLDDTFLMRGIVKSSGVPPEYDESYEAVNIIANNVRNTAEGVILFRYYDNSGNEITDYSNVASVAFIDVRIVVNVNPSTLPNNFTLRSTAALRNMSPVFRNEQ